MAAVVNGAVGILILSRASWIREATRQLGALLIFDEITIDWQLVCGAAHLGLGGMPDMAVFAKALGNGHPMAAVIGSRTAMEGARSAFIG